MRKVALYEQRRYGGDLRALISEGILGLFRALQSFDPNRGFRFATYAVFWIRVYMRDNALKMRSVVKRPLSRSAVNSNQKALGEDNFAFSSTHFDVSLDKDDGEDGQSWVENLPDTRPTPEENFFREAERNRQKANVSRALRMLTEKERYVILNRFSEGKPRPFCAIAPEIGLSIEGTRQVEKRALTKLKKILLQERLLTRKEVA